MKSYVKGVITGFLVGALIFAVPAIAENIDALFNQVRINVNGVDQIQWGEDIDLGDGESAPSSILYNGTTYLPMRKLGELSGQEIYWNGDSKTVSMTGVQKDINVVAEKTDKNGNVWKYYTFKDDNGYSYLGVKDEARGYERVYHIASANGGKPVRVTDNAIYFLKRYEVNDYFSAYLMKLPFNNDEGTQDGDILDELKGGYGEKRAISSAVFEDNIVCYYDSIPHSNYNGGNIIAYDYENNIKTKFSLGVNQFATNIRVEGDNEKVTFTYELIGSGYSQGDYAVVFDKNSFTFGEQYKAEDNNETN